MKTAQYISRRGVYGQNAGELVRGGKDNGAAVLSEWSADAKVAEGKEIAVLTAKFRAQDWKGFNDYVEELRRKGFAQFIVERMITLSTVGRI